MTSLEFFSGTSQVTSSLINKGVKAKCLDIKQLRASYKIDYLCDFMDFDYKAFTPDTFKILFFGVPCQAFSKASGGAHFDKNFIPQSQTAMLSIKIVKRMFEIIDYFDKSIFYIENPAGGLYRYLLKENYLPRLGINVYRLDLIIYGFPTKKQTDIITNSEIPILTNPVVRVNGKHQKAVFNNLTLKQRQAYPKPFCDMIAENAILNF